MQERDFHYYKANMYTNKIINVNNRSKNFNVAYYPNITIIESIMENLLLLLESKS